MMIDTRGGSKGRVGGVGEDETDQNLGINYVVLINRFEMICQRSAEGIGVYRWKQYKIKRSCRILLIKN